MGDLLTSGADLWPIQQLTSDATLHTMGGCDRPRRGDETSGSGAAARAVTVYLAGAGLTS